MHHRRPQFPGRSLWLEPHDKSNRVSMSHSNKDKRIKFVLAETFDTLENRICEGFCTAAVLSSLGWKGATEQLICLMSFH